MDCTYICTFIRLWYDLHSIKKNNNFVFKYWDPWRWQRPCRFGKYSRTLIPVETFRSSSRHSCGSWHSPHRLQVGLHYNPCKIHWIRFSFSSVAVWLYSAGDRDFFFVVPPTWLTVSYLSKSVDVGPNCVSSADKIQGAASPGYHRQTN